MTRTDTIWTPAVEAAPLGRNQSLARPVLFGWTAMQLRLLVLIFSLFMIDGFDQQMLVLALPALTKAWGMSAEQFRFAVSAGYLGIVIGASLGGLMSDWVGRRLTIIGFACLFGPTTLLMSQASNPEQLAMLRIIAGLGLGGCMPPSLSLLTESVKAYRRGLVVSLAMVSAPLGTSCAGAVAGFVVPQYGWQTIFLLGGTLAIAITTALALWLPESIAFLVRRPEQAERMEGLANRLGVAAPAVAIDEETEFHSGARGLFDSKLRGVAFGMIVAFICAYGAGGIMLGWLPAFLSRHGFDLAEAAFSLSVWSVCGIVGSLMIGWILARRTAWQAVTGVTLFAICAALATMAMFAISAMPSVTATFALIGISGALCSAIIIVLFACVAEIFPAAVRSSALGFATTAGKIGGFSGSFAGASFIGGPGYFLAYAVVLVGLLAAILLARRNSRKAGLPD